MLHRFLFLIQKKNLARTRHRIGVGRHPSKRYSYLAGFNWVCILLETRCIASYFELLLPTSHPDISLTLPSQRFLSPVHDWQLSFLVECLMWTWKFIVAFREEMSSCGRWARDSHIVFSFLKMKAALWRNQSRTWRVEPGRFQQWNGLSLQGVIGVDHHHLHLHYSFSSCLKLVKHIQRVSPCAQYFLHLTIVILIQSPKGASYILLSSHLTGKHFSEERSYLFKFLWLACVWAVWSRVWILLLNHPAPLFVL